MSKKQTLTSNNKIVFFAMFVCSVIVLCEGYLKSKNLFSDDFLFVWAYLIGCLFILFVDWMDTLRERRQKKMFVCMNKSWTAILAEAKELWRDLSLTTKALSGYMKALEIIFDEHAYLNIEYFIYHAPSLGDNAIVTDREGEKYNFNKLEEAVKFFEKWYPL